MNLRLRAATTEDQGFLRELHRLAYEDVVTRQFGLWDDSAQWRRFDSKLQCGAFRIVELDGLPIAAVWSSEHDDHIFLHELLVLPGFQDRGIGSQVLRWELARADSVKKVVRLHTLVLNRAQEFYKRHGFIETGRGDVYVDMERAAGAPLEPRRSATVAANVKHSMSEEPRLREARAGDVELLCDIIVRAFAEYEGRLEPPSGVQSETVASLAEKLKEGGALVCEAGGVAVGCVLYAPKVDYLYVGRLAVLPEWRGHGIGDLLLRAVEHRAGDLGLQRIRLGVRLALGKLRSYYESRGYIPIAFRSHVGYTQATYVEMEKALGRAAT